MIKLPVASYRLYSITYGHILSSVCHHAADSSRSDSLSIHSFIHLLSK